MSGSFPGEAREEEEILRTMVPTPPRPAWRSGLCALVGALAAGALAAPGVAAAPGYEKVTPEGKSPGEVHQIDTFRSNDDGSRFLLTTSGPFASLGAETIPLYVRYLARRGPDGWSLLPTDAPTGPMFEGMVMNTVVSSDDLSHVLVPSTFALTPGAIPGGGNLYVRNTTTGAYTLVAADENRLLADQFMRYQGNYNAKYLSNDGRTAVFVSGVPLVPGAPAGLVAYRWTADAGIEAVSVLEDDTIVAGGAIDKGDEVGVRDPRPRVDELDRLFFKRTDGVAAQRAVYLRRGDSTVLVSQVRTEGAEDGIPRQADVLATSRDGRYAAILVYGGSAGTVTRLTDDAPIGIPTSGSTRVIYRYDSETDTLNYVGHGTSTMVGPIVGISDDGQTIAFRSTTALHPDAVAGQVNVYVWRDGELQLAYVADPGHMTLADRDQRMLSRNGRYLVFSDASPSVAAQFGFDNTGSASDCPDTSPAGACLQVYRFDSDAPDPASALVCVSCRTDGESPRGHAGDPTNGQPGYIRMDAHQTRMALDDGRVLFTSPDDLVPADGNGLPDVYEYDDGEWTLISRGSAGRPARLLDVSADGQSVFFSTNDPISLLDTDDEVDVYVLRTDARPDPVSDESRTPACVGSGCRSAAPAPPVAPAIGSIGFVGGGDLPRPLAKATVRVSRLKAVFGSAATLKVRVPGAGRISVAGAAIRRSTRAAGRAGQYRVRIALKARARRSLKRKGSLKATVRVSYRARDGRRVSKRVTVTFKRPKAAKRKGGR